MNRPLPNTYWVIKDLLLAGEYPGDLVPENAEKKVNTLLDIGIKHFIDLTKKKELIPYSGLLYQKDATYERLAFNDNEVPPHPTWTHIILNKIDKYIHDDGEPTYVHCYGGAGRTGLIIGCWLTRHGFTGDQAIDRVAKWWSWVEKAHRLSSPATDEQMQYIYDWHKKDVDIIKGVLSTLKDREEKVERLLTKRSKYDIICP